MSPSEPLQRLMPDTGGLQPIRILNNQDWLGKMGLMEFLRDVGRFVPVESMLAKESVQGRLQAGRDINYAELSYQVLQAYDYLYLNRQHNVEVQLGGHDQWSNILAGIELVHTLEGERVFGLEFPWLQTQGKTDREPVWLSSKKNPPAELFRTLLQAPDRDVVRLLKQLTFLPLDQIGQMAKSMTEPDYTPGTLQLDVEGRKSPRQARVQASGDRVGESTWQDVAVPKTAFLSVASAVPLRQQG